MNKTINSILAGIYCAAFVYYITPVISIIANDLQFPSIGFGSRAFYIPALLSLAGIYGSLTNRRYSYLLVAALPAHLAFMELFTFATRASLSTKQAVQLLCRFSVWLLVIALLTNICKRMRT